MRRLRVLFLFLTATSAYVGNTASNVYVRRLGAHSISDPPTPPSPPTQKTTFGGKNNGEDVRILTAEQVDGLLEEWTIDPRWHHDDIATMVGKVKAAGKDDIFFAYCPIYNGRRSVRYIFHTQVVMQGSAPILQVNHATKCPFDPSSISSVGFKDSLTKVLPILPIDFTPLLESPRFGLSWNLRITNDTSDQS